MYLLRFLRFLRFLRCISPITIFLLAICQQYTILEHAILEHAILEHAILENAILENAILEHAILENAILERAILEHAILENAILENAILENAQRTRVTNTFLSEASMLMGGASLTILKRAVEDYDPEHGASCVLNPYDTKIIDENREPADYIANYFWRCIDPAATRQGRTLWKTCIRRYTPLRNRYLKAGSQPIKE